MLFLALNMDGTGLLACFLFHSGFGKSYFVTQPQPSGEEGISSPFKSSSRLLLNCLIVCAPHLDVTTLLNMAHDLLLQVAHIVFQLFQQICSL